MVRGGAGVPNDGPARALDSRLVRAGVVAWTVIGALILLAIVLRFVVAPLLVLAAPLVIGIVIAYLLNPIVSRLEDRGLRRVWGALIVYAVFLALLGVALRFLIPMVGTQVANFARAVPDLLARAQEALSDVARRFGADMDAAAVVGDLGPQGPGGEFISRLFSVTASVVHGVVVLFFGALLGFYILVDLPNIQRAALAAVPARRQREVRAVLHQIGRALGGFFRGQLLVALFVGVASMLALFFVGLPYWALVGMVAGLFNLVPLVGPFIGAVPALFIAFTTDASGGVLHLEPGWPLALGAAIALLVVQQLDNHIISPNVVARTVKLHPVTVMLGLLAGGSIAGLWGMLLTVPLIASTKILLLHVWDTRLRWPPPQPAADDEAAEPSAARPAAPV